MRLLNSPPKGVRLEYYSVKYGGKTDNYYYMGSMPEVKDIGILHIYEGEEHHHQLCGRTLCKIIKENLMEELHNTNNLEVKE